ncbi:MAG: radical SAM protein, partial [Patescibacteria group bacterium]
EETPSVTLFTSRGCPFSCTFCDWGSNTKSKVMRFELDTLYKELEWFAERKIEFIFCCDANFGIFPRDVDIARKAAEVKAKYGYPHALSVQNAKNAEERIFQAQKILADAGLNKGVTLAFQSRSPEVLKAIDRENISSIDFINLNRRFVEANIETYSDMIIALSKETYDSFADGIALTIKEGQHNRIQFGNLSMMPNAPMAEPEYIEKYGLKTVEVESVIYHGVIDEDPGGIPETEDIVIETKSMSREDWVRTRVFCWTTSLLHFDKIFQIPLIILAETTLASYRDLIEVFTEGDLTEFPILSEIGSFFTDKAKSIQQGGIEQCPSKEWLNIYWPPDEFIFIKLCREGKLDQFYVEAKNALFRFFASRPLVVDPQLLKEAIGFNRALVKLPFCDKDLVFESSYNLREFYQGKRAMREVELEKGSFRYSIDRASQKWWSWEDWFRYVVWYGNKRGAYLYGNQPMGSEIGGHF